MVVALVGKKAICVIFHLSNGNFAIIEGRQQCSSKGATCSDIDGYETYRGATVKLLAEHDTGITIANKHDRLYDKDRPYTNFLQICILCIGCIVNGGKVLWLWSYL